MTTYRVSFHFTDGTAHDVADPLTAEQIANLRSVLNRRLVPPPHVEPDELDMDGADLVAPEPDVTFRFDSGDFGMIVPANKIVRITWRPV